VWDQRAPFGYHRDNWLRPYWRKFCICLSARGPSHYALTGSHAVDGCIVPKSRYLNMLKGGYAIKVWKHCIDEKITFSALRSRALKGLNSWKAHHPGWSIAARNRFELRSESPTTRDVRVFCQSVLFFFPPCFHQNHSAFIGKTPYEQLKSLLKYWRLSAGFPRIQ
jgi:hypothetical protein